MQRKARRILLPSLELTETSLPTDENVIEVNVLLDGVAVNYHVRKKFEDSTQNRIDSKPNWMGSRFNLFPVVLDRDGVPWAEANIYILSRIQSTLNPTMSTYASTADSLAAYRRFLDEKEIDWTEFPPQKQKRPTYRYSAYLRMEIAAGQIQGTTAKRHMSKVISFYTWLIEEGVLNPAHSPWKKQDRFLSFTDIHGFKLSKQVVSTDLSIKITKSTDPYDGRIDDGGKLRPLPSSEQEFLIDALIELKNTEMLLIHLIGLLTGARIQTILTMRLKHVLQLIDHIPSEEIRIPAGPGTGMDTKYNKKIVLHFPKWLYKKLHIYAGSERARLRRSRSPRKDDMEQYLFLSNRGDPFYTSKSDSAEFNSSNRRRHAKNGQAVRQFITERIIPILRLKTGDPNFHYQFHDTRASYGMNLTDCQLAQVNLGEVSLHQAREFVKARMSHESTTTTDRYLQYRSNLKIVSSINSMYHEHLIKLQAKLTENTK